MLAFQQAGAEPGLLISIIFVLVFGFIGAIYGCLLGLAMDKQ